MGPESDETTLVGAPPAVYVVQCWAERSIQELYEVLHQLSTAISEEAQACGQVVDRVRGAQLKLKWALDGLATNLGHQDVTKR